MGTLTTTTTTTDEDTTSKQLCTNETHPSPKLPLLLQFGDGLSCYSDALYSALVGAPADSEEAFLAPAVAPAVLDDPVLLSHLVALAVAHQQHGVVGQLKGVVGVQQARVVVDALLVVHEVIVHLKTGLGLWVRV